MTARFNDRDADLFGDMARALREAAEELRAAKKVKRDRLSAQRLETYAREIELNLRQPDLFPNMADAGPPVRNRRRKGS
ncbi:hypothetical protein [Inquilinus sp. CAU 1745]|uniref:hypothetical protein n=1 Tax=Inquilinus sp. CAU 1745 TaxID=3140369 RepID=UPI00325B94A5